MPAAATIHARAFARAVEVLDRAGADTASILGAVGLDRDALAEPERRIPFARFIDFYEGAAHATRDPHFGLHVGARTHLNTYEALGYAALSDATVADALGTLSRYFALICDGAEVALRENGEEVAIGYRIVGGAPPRARQVVELSLAVLLRWMQSLLGDGWAPRTVRFSHASPDSRDELHRVFGTSLEFDRRANELGFEPALLSRAPPTSDPRLRTLMERDLSESLAQLPDPDDFLDVIRRLIADGLQQRHSDIERVARALHMSVRTLQRRLSAHGSSYRALLDDTRQRLAERYLGDSRFTIGEIAFLLGYAELSAFTHAFRRWRGESPAAFRRRERGD